MADKDTETLMNTLKGLAGGQGQQQPSVTIGKVIAQLQHIEGYLHHLEQGVVNMAAEVQRVSLMNQMFAKVLVEKNVITEPELQTLYHDEVFLPMKNANDAFQAKMQEAVQQAQTVSAATQSPLVTTEDQSDSDDDSDDDTVVLASERFKRKTDEED